MNKNIHKNEQVLQQLEWDILKKKMTHLCHFHSTYSDLLTPVPLKRLRSTYDQTQTLLELINEEDYHQLNSDLLFLNKEIDPTETLDSIQKEKILQIETINDFVNCIEFTHGHLKTLFKVFKFDEEVIRKGFQQFKKNFLVAFRKFVDEDGSVHYERHPKLAHHYQELQTIQTKARETITHLINDNEISKLLQYDSHDVIQDRFVIPVKSDSYNHQVGSIISRSESGQTLFVQPHNLAKLNDRCAELNNIIFETLLTIERELSQDLSRHLLFFYHCAYLLKSLDIYRARARFALEYNLCKPQLTKDRVIILENFFHPLIDSPIKNDLSITSEQAGLVISGPNTGGKTATLKVLALTQIFLTLGLYVPASSAKLHRYKRLFFFGNDQQNLEQGLSSFSAEVKNYIELLQSLESSNLILIDEIFNSTSSEEASALARAIFNQIAALGNSHLIVSTHHQTLKTLTHGDKKFVSAHVGFDMDKNQPTFKLHYGAPGSSFALNIFQKLTENQTGFENLYSESKKFLDNNVIHYEKLLAQIAQKENDLSKLISENKELNTQLKNQKDAMKGVIQLKTEEAMNNTRAEIKVLKEKAQDILKKVKAGKITNANKLDQLYSPLERKTESKKQKPEKKLNLIDPEEILVGSKYYSTLLRQEVEVKKIDQAKGYAQVSIGKMSVKAPLDSLKQTTHLPNKPKQNIVINFEKSESHLSFDCRGMRLSEFQNLVEAEIANLLYGGIPYLEFIHGHGEGILKNWLRKYIRMNKSIKVDQNEDGNDGSTRVVIV